MVIGELKFIYYYFLLQIVGILTMHDILNNDIVGMIQQLWVNNIYSKIGIFGWRLLKKQISNAKGALLYCL